LASKGIFRLTTEYLVCRLFCRAGDSAGQVILLSKQDMLFEELATPKRTTYSYGEALNELWKAGIAEYLKSI
jgi:hypothetical protein